MDDNGTQSVFRKKTLERVSSPDQLTDYLRVTNPTIWVILAAVISLLVGLFAWSMVGTLETTADVKVVVLDETAMVVTLGSENLSEGMPLRVGEQEFQIASVQSDEYERTIGVAQVDLPDGMYDGTVVVDAVHPISFLLESR